MLIPLSRQHEFLGEFKQSSRRDDDLAVANAAFRLLLQPRAEGVQGLLTSRYMYPAQHLHAPHMQHLWL